VLPRCFDLIRLNLVPILTLSLDTYLHSSGPGVCYCPSQIFELRHVYNATPCYTYITIVIYIFVTREQHMPSFSVVASRTMVFNMRYAYPRGRNRLRGYEKMRSLRVDTRDTMFSPSPGCQSARATLEALPPCADHLILQLQWSVLRTNEWSGHGLTALSGHRQFLHGGLREGGP
jgi:hypothetical protein